MNLPALALSINQPWAWLIAAGLKDIENRDWRTDFRGEFLIHAGLRTDRDCHGSLIGGHHPVTGDTWCGQHGNPYPTGGMVGIAEVVDCVSKSDSPWFVGRYGLVITNARPIEFIPCVGALGFFKPDFSRTYKAKASPAQREPKPVPMSQSSSPDLFE